MEKHYFSIGFQRFNGHHLLSGIVFVESDKSELTAVEAIALASKQLGTDAGTLTSFSPISKKQYDLFMKEKRREASRTEEPTDNGMIYILQ